MNPVLPAILLIPLLILVVVAGAWLSWRGTRNLAAPARNLVPVLRTSALTALALMLINPGRWTSQQDENGRVWQVLVDRSTSMAVADEAGGESRLQRAQALANEISVAAAEGGGSAVVQSFGADLVPGSGEVIVADAEASDLASSSGTLLASVASGAPPAGVIVLSDGRQTSGLGADGVDPHLIATARSMGVPFHAIALGGSVESPDVEVLGAKRMMRVFAGQELSLPVGLEATAMEPTRLRVWLRDGQGEQVAEQFVDHSGSGREVAVFRVAAPDQSSVWTVGIDPAEGESRSNNNSARTHLRVIESKTRVFLAEGAPYWDSKFLAQMLRQQDHIDIRSVYRLSDQRFFEVHSEGDVEGDAAEAPEGAAKSAFPATAEELARYDLIVFGKGIESFLDNARIDLLRSYVRDAGGAVLFSRGRPYSRDMPALAVLEPVTWAEGSASEFQLYPSADGEAAGLFDQALPAADSAVWKQLPPLQDARRIDQVKPFTRVLAEGQLAGVGGRFPVLMVRRYGQGVTGVVNADGVWKWDFFPEAREMGNMYLEFWTQLLQWMASYSEFLPGQDYALAPSSSKAAPGDTVGLRLAYRGELDDPSPRVNVTQPSGEVLTLSPGRTPGTARPEWRGGFEVDAPGDYTVTVSDEATDAPMPEWVVNVPRPPVESDDLSADLDFLAGFVAATGGQMIAREEEGAWDEFLAEVAGKAAETAAVDSGAIWAPLWRNWLWPAILVILMGVEWYLRRRNGLT